MRTGKLFIGKRVRDIRTGSGDTQAAFAAKLGISTSYLNQIENNQRAVSAGVLMMLADKFQVDLRALGGGEDDRLLSALSEALADPVFEAHQPSLNELRMVARNTPSIARALLQAHDAYRRASERLAGYDSRSEASGETLDPTAYEQVRDYFYFVDNYIDDLDVAAEQLAARFRIPVHEPGAVLAAHLEKRHKVRIVSAPSNEAPLRKYDAKAKALFLNPSLSAPSRNFLLAYQIGVLEFGEMIERLAARSGLAGAEALEVCKIGLANYFAGALLLPYKGFRDSANEFRHDLELLAMRFYASLEQVAHRMSTLQRPGDKGVPVFFARIDRAGNITKRHSAAKLQFARYGGACPLWNVHQAFETPGRFVRQLAQTPDGAKYLCVATEVAKGVGGFMADRRRYAIALGCESHYADQFVYSEGLELGDKGQFEQIGISCRICERANCSHRSVPPLRRNLVVDPSVRHIVPYSLK